MLTEKCDKSIAKTNRSLRLVKTGGSTQVLATDRDACIDYSIEPNCSDLSFHAK